MPFDHEERISPPSLIMPIHSHPRSDATHVVLARSMDGSYFQGSNHARYLGNQMFPWNGKQPNDLQELQWMVESSLAPVSVLKMAQLPDRITHIVAIAHFRVGLGNVAGTATSPISGHRVSLTNGTNTDTGQAVSVQHPPFAFFTNASFPLNGIDPVNPYQDAYQVGCVVELANTLDGETLRAGPWTITLEAMALDAANGAINYAPIMVTYWYEVHG